MINTYREACTFGYRPTRFLQMVEEQGGVNAAKALLAPGRVPDGFSTLWEKNRLDISVEYVVLDPRWRSLFTLGELQEAQRRLDEVNWETPANWRVDRPVN